MSFQAYINNIKEKTGKGPDDFRKLAEKKGFTQNGQIKPGIKAGEIVAWLKEEYDLGHGHSMAIYALLKGIKNDKSQYKMKIKKWVETTIENPLKLSTYARRTCMTWHCEKNKLISQDFFCFSEPDDLLERI